VWSIDKLDRHSSFTRTLLYCIASCGRARSPLDSAPPRHYGKACEARSEQRDGRGLGYRRREFGDDDLSIAGLKTGHQDLVRASVEGAAPPTPTATKVRSRTAGTAAVATATTSTVECPATAAPETALTADAETFLGRATGEIWERGAAIANTALAGTEEAATSAPKGRLVGEPGINGATVAPGTAAAATTARETTAHATTVRAGEEPCPHQLGNCSGAGQRDLTSNPIVWRTEPISTSRL
jgi:hypothetical protein